jgi:hypothetical protein
MRVFTFEKMTVFILSLVLAVSAGLRWDADAQVGCTLVGDAPAKLAWQDNSTNEDGFEIERAVNGGSFAALTTVGANVVAHEDKTVTEGNKYDYRVRAFNKGGKTAYTNVACKQIRVLPPNGAPSGLVIE